MNKTVCTVITMVAMGVGTAATAAKSLRNDEAPRTSVKTLQAKQKTAARRTPARPAVKKDDQDVKKQQTEEKPSSRTDRRHA